MKTILLTLTIFSIVLSNNYDIDNYIGINDTVQFTKYNPQITCEQRNYSYYPNQRVKLFGETNNDTTYTVENNGNEYLIIRKYEVVDTVKVKVMK
jgi:hypothetical protein